MKYIYICIYIYVLCRSGGLGCLLWKRLSPHEKKIKDYCSLQIPATFSETTMKLPWIINPESDEMMLHLGGGFKYFFIFPPTWGNHPIWLIFFKWVETTHQCYMMWKKHHVLHDLWGWHSKPEVELQRSLGVFAVLREWGQCFWNLDRFHRGRRGQQRMTLRVRFLVGSQQKLNQRITTNHMPGQQQHDLGEDLRNVLNVCAFSYVSPTRNNILQNHKW